MALVLALLAAGAADARAATVTSTQRFDTDSKTYGRFVTEIHYDAAPGEANRLVAYRDGLVWRIRDPGAAIVPGGVCRAADEHELVCEPTTRDSEVHAALGDGDDELFGLGDVRAEGGDGGDRLVAYKADGGPGNDVLEGGDVRGGEGADRLAITGGGPRVAEGGDGDDVITGTDGGDVLVGGPGSDVIEARRGRDYVADEGDSNGDGTQEIPARDRLDGGPGYDYLSYTGRRAPVRVDLAVRDDQAPNHDDVARFEDVSGGDGDDVLRGDGGRNLLTGARGDDRLEGRGGRDLLFGYEGDDILLGGPGGDNLVAGSGRDRVDGGRGGDRLWTAKDRARDRVRCGAGDRGKADQRDRLAGVCGGIMRLPSR